MTQFLPCSNANHWKMPNLASIPEYWEVSSIKVQIGSPSDAFFPLPTEVLIKNQTVAREFLEEVVIKTMHTAGHDVYVAYPSTTTDYLVVQDQFPVGAQSLSLNYGTYTNPNFYVEDLYFGQYTDFVDPCDDRSYFLGTFLQVPRTPLSGEYYELKFSYTE